MYSLKILGLGSLFYSFKSLFRAGFFFVFLFYFRGPKSSIFVWRPKINIVIILIFLNRISVILFFFFFATSTFFSKFSSVGLFQFLHSEKQRERFWTLFRFRPLKVKLYKIEKCVNIKYVSLEHNETWNVCS